MATDPKELSVHEELVVETEIDGAPIALPVFVTNVLATELWLATRLPEPRLLSLIEGQPIHLTLDRDGALIIESAFLRRLGGGSRLGMEKSRVFAVRRPQGVETAMRRAHVRVDLDRMVRIRALGSLGTEKMGNGRTVNIGAGGVQFLTDMPLLFGEQLRVALVLSSREIVVAGGTIVRIEDGDMPANDDGPATSVESTEKAPATRSKVAVRFDKISEVDQERITCHILSAHRRRSKDIADLAALTQIGLVPTEVPQPAAESSGPPAPAALPSPAAPPIVPVAPEAAETVADPLASKPKAGMHLDQS